MHQWVSLIMVLCYRFENALREMVPGVTVPYWDSTLDDGLPDPTQSVLFTETFLGDGFGIVQTGPFAHWNTLSGPLTRNIGQSGELFKPADIARIITRLRLAEISEPNAPVNSSLEFHHNQVHLWIGGQMGSLHTAAHDPVFWLHHSYVDYVWEQFRRYQRASGVDPTRDYPTVVNDSMHMPGVAMGLSNFRNMDGLSDMFTSRIYTYEQSPTCSQRFPNCGSPYLRCVMFNRRPRCISADRMAAPQPSPVLMGFGMGGAAVNLMAAVRNQQNQQQAIQQQQLQRTMAMRQNLVNMAMLQQRIVGSQMAQRPNFMMPQQQQAIMPQQQMIPPQQMIPQVGMPNVQGQGQMTSEGEGGDDPTEGGAQGGQRRKRYSREKRKASLDKENFNKINRQARQANVQNMGMTANNQMSNRPGLNFVQNATTTRFLSHNLNTCPTVPLSHGYQNTFNINGQSDINQWVYIPVKVVYQRPGTYVTYTSFPVVNGEPDEEHDIYSVGTQRQIKNYVVAGKPAFYDKCLAQESGAGKVYVHSQGINYMGTYKEYSIVDHRLAVSISTAYVAVKSPEFGATQVYLSAYDSCGRVCQPYCKMAGMPGLQRCSGAFRITSDYPKLYGMNYGEAVSSMWQFNVAGGCPSLSQDNVYIEFYCSYSDTWPFTISGAGNQPLPTAQIQNAPQPPVVPDEMEPAEQVPGANSSIVAGKNRIQLNVINSV